MAQRIVFFEDMAFNGNPGQPWNTPWVPFPARYSSAQLVVICKSRIDGTLSVQLQTTWDTSSARNVAPLTSVSAVGTTITEIDLAVGNALGPLVRLNLDGTADTQVVISAYLIPKRT